MKFLDFIVKENEQKKIDKLKKILEGLSKDTEYYFKELKATYLEFSPHTFILIYCSILMEPNMRMSIFYGYLVFLYKVLPDELINFLSQHDKDDAIVNRAHKKSGGLGLSDTNLLIEIYKFESLLDYFSVNIYERIQTGELDAEKLFPELKLNGLKDQEYPPLVFTNTFVRSDSEPDQTFMEKYFCCCGALFKKKHRPIQVLTTIV